MKYTDLLKDAAVIVRGKLLWKRFIDGTPLSNDLPFWMADFAAAAAAQERDAIMKSIEELRPVEDNPLLQNKPAAFWIENFRQIVYARSNT